MKRNAYVDNQGNAINENFESKRILLKFFFLIGTIIPIVLIGFIIYTVFENSKCAKMYDSMKVAVKDYLKDEDKFPSIEGESVIVSMGKLYKERYLNTYSTENMTCTGEIKVTNYKGDYFYTLKLKNCNSCSTTKYKSWSNELNSIPNKLVVDIVPYYNYYERQTVVTDWSKYYEQSELQKKKSKYGIKLPIEEEKMESTVPEEASIAEVQKEEVYFYRYKDKLWKWYNIKGDYSDYSSEKPDGYSKKDEDTVIYTDWTKYSLSHPAEKEYRKIRKSTGYHYYYEEDGEKIYANNKNYVAYDDVDHEKYNKHEGEGVAMFSYQDTKWRWYNGEKRKYSGRTSLKPDGYNYKDEGTVMESTSSDWSDKTSITNANKEYRVEDKKTMTRFRYIYEILSDPLLDEPITRNMFVDTVNMPIDEFVLQDDYKMEVSYKFKYMKR